MKLRPKTKVTIVITNMNGEKWIRNLIDSIYKSSYNLDDIEIILVDNNSKDNSVNIFKSIMRPDKGDKIIMNTQNTGWSHAVNQGILASSGDIIIVLSNDMEIDNKAIEVIVNIMNNNSEIGILQLNSKSLYDRKTLDSGMNFLDKFGYSYSYEPTQDTFLIVFFAEGMAFAIRKDIISKVGLLDDFYFMEYDDMDFSWRTLLFGYKVAFIPKAIVYHARGGTVGNTYYNRNLLNITLYSRNHIITLIKNYELRTLIYVLPITISIETIKIIFFIFKGNIKIAIANFKGIFSVFLSMKETLRKRALIQKNRKINDKEIIKLMHPFSISTQIAFINRQSSGQRYFLKYK